MALGLRYTYPGYLEASDGAGTLPSKGPDGGIGTLRMQLAELEESPTRFDALVCLDTTQISTLADDRYRLPTGDPFYVLHAYRISARLSDPATEPPTSPSSEDLLVPSETYVLAGPPGRDARPSGDVFGNWKITEFAMSAAPEDRDPCLAWAEQRWGGPNPPAPTRTDAEPPAIEPFHPGW
ncbi:hypothetical protein [Prescottella sp. R16]|uniref:hypothetical protein n=1 Tax=Prescottella sp. R16 TaxID=3064529 RepID=UPI00272EA67F|nr:hypothetical protein [Prescottella sp. R16]